MKKIILLTVLLFTSALAYELTEIEKYEWCQFYSDLGGQFHYLATHTESKDEYATETLDYIRQLDAISVTSGWTDQNREVWIPEFIKLAETAWELRNSLTTGEVEQAVYGHCIEDQSDDGGTEYGNLQTIQI